MVCLSIVCCGRLRIFVIMGVLDHSFCSWATHTSVLKALLSVIFLFSVKQYTLEVTLNYSFGKLATLTIDTLSLGLSTKTYTDVI